MLSDVKDMLKGKFNMKYLGKLPYYLGIKFKQVEEEVKMSQKDYVDQILKRLDMISCKPRSTPSELKIQVESTETIDAIQTKKYFELVGSLIYLMICTRPDICYIITKLSQHLSNPHQEHWIAAKHVLRYLKQQKM